MSRQWKTVVRLSFHGERFRDHALDVAALREVVQYQRVVEETAKCLWRSQNPDRERLPKRFEERVRLYLRAIQEGSAVAPLDVLIQEPEQRDLFAAEPPELGEALEVTQEVFDALAVDDPFPARFPRQLIDDYARFGEGLTGGERVEIALASGRTAEVTELTRARLLSRSQQPHEAEVQLVGVVLEADVRQCRFQLWTDDRTSVTVQFSSEQEDSVTNALRQHCRSRLRIRGRAEISAGGRPVRVVEVAQLDLEPIGAISFNAEAPLIEDVLAQIAAEVPASEWERLPIDLSEHLDHYIYGTPKR
jgi:hypothetical protein